VSRASVGFTSAFYPWHEERRHML